MTFEYSPIVSDGNVYVRNTRAEAINAFLDDVLDDHPTPKGVVRLFSVSNRYPRLKKFDDDNSNLGQYISDPDFIWDSANQTSGSLRGFATGFRQISGPVQEFYYLTWLQVFSDNAFNVMLSVYDPGTRTKLFDVTPSGGLQDGNMDPNTGLVETRPPYGWQNIRYYSNTFTLSGTGSYVVVLSFEVQNYLVPDDLAFNPAALAFLAKFYVGTSG